MAVFRMTVDLLPEDDIRVDPVATYELRDFDSETIRTVHLRTVGDCLEITGDRWLLNGKTPYPCSPQDRTVVCVVVH